MLHGRVVALAVVSLGAVAAAAPAHGAVPRQAGGFKYTTPVPGAPTGKVLDLGFTNPENPGGKPHTVRTMVVHGPAGGTIDTSVPPRCHASDAQLRAQGPSACPPESKIGSGFSLSDTGDGGPFPRYSEATLTNFNAKDEVIGVGVLKSALLLRFADRTKIRGNTTTTNFPQFPGRPPPDPYTPLKRLLVTFPPYVRGGRTYMRTPPSCPAVGYWTTTLEFTYVDGVKQRLISRSPCQAREAAARRCLPHRSAIGRRNIGRLRLGYTRRRLLRLPVRPVRRTRRSYRYCVRGSRGGVTAVFSRRGRVVLLTTTARSHGDARLRPGSGRRALRRAYPRRRPLARGVYRASPRSARLIGVHRGRVGFIAVADRNLLCNPRTLRRYLRLGRL